MSVMKFRGLQLTNEERKSIKAHTKAILGDENYAYVSDLFIYKKFKSKI